MEPDTLELNFGVEEFPAEAPELHAVASRATEATTAMTAVVCLIFIRVPFERCSRRRRRRRYWGCAGRNVTTFPHPYNSGADQQSQPSGREAPTERHCGLLPVNTRRRHGFLVAPR